MKIVILYLALLASYQCYQETDSCTNTSANRISAVLKNASVCYLEYYFFSSFGLIDLPCDLSSLESRFNYSVQLDYVIMFSSEQVLLESSLDLRIGVNYIKEGFSVILGNLKGFLVESGHAFLTDFYGLEIQVQASNLQLYWKGIEVDSIICAQLADVSIHLFANL